MAPGVSAILLERLRRYRAEAFVASGPLAVRALQSELAAIPVESTRDGAMRRFHILLVCASVMKRDPTNYHRAVAKAYDGLISFLQDGPPSSATRPSGRQQSAAPFPTATAVRQDSESPFSNPTMPTNDSAAPFSGAATVAIESNETRPATIGGGPGSASPFPRAESGV
jgi:hypothetical protein